MKNPNSKSDPLVSCLMVTLGGSKRLPLIKRSIQCFRKQSYDNKELVIVLDSVLPSWRRQMSRLVESYRSPHIRLITVSGRHKLGSLRNLSVKNARGEILCQWDDDDLSHPRRIEEQLRLLKKKNADAVLLEDAFHVFLEGNTVFWVNWSFSPDRGLPGTLMIRKNSCPKYPALSRKEDSAFTQLLLKRRKVVPLRSMPQLYVYICHENNTWGLDHHFKNALLFAVTRKKILPLKKNLLSGLREAGFVTTQLVFRDRRGPIFTWRKRSG